MIKFFRKLRQRILTENLSTQQAGKSCKNPLHAFGKIALVMIGILLALQVNNQNEIRKSNNLCKTYEPNIISELKTDLLRLKQRDNFVNICKATIEDYVDYHNSEKPTRNITKSKADSTGLNLNFFCTTKYSKQDLVSTGNLKLFPTQMRNAILKYKNDTDRLAVAELKSLEQVDEVGLDYRKKIDMLYSYSYNKKEHSEVKNWEYRINSPQMRLRNNTLAYFLNLYEKQGRFYENITKETNELMVLLENNNNKG